MECYVNLELDVTGVCNVSISCCIINSAELDVTVIYSIVFVYLGCTNSHSATRLVQFKWQFGVDWKLSPNSKM